MKKSKSRSLGQTVMTDEELALFCKVCTENGSDSETALEDAFMIDHLFVMERSAMLTMGTRRYTDRGNIRKNITRLSDIENLIDARVRGVSMLFN